MKEVISVRKISTLHDLRNVYKLTNDVYSRSGIASASTNGMMIYHPEQDVMPQTHVFVAEVNGVMIGTITLSIDNAFGLMVDSGFKPIIDQYRTEYKNLASFWRFAVLPDYQSNLVVMRKLIGLSALSMVWNKAQVCFLIVSPKHIGFYQKVLAFEEVAWGIDTNPHIKAEHAQVVLMKIHIENIPVKWVATPESEIFV